jgi:hypothetical protein
MKSFVRAVPKDCSKIPPDARRVKQDIGHIFPSMAVNILEIMTNLGLTGCIFNTSLMGAGFCGPASLWLA